MPYTQIIYQVVFATKYRRKVLTKPNRDNLIGYFYGLFKKKKCFVHAINGVSDHFHFVFALHPTVALSDLVKDLKLSSHYRIKDAEWFPEFDRWCTGYAAFTYSKEALPNLIRYVANQERHHGEETSLEELRRLLDDHGVAYDEAYLE